MVGVADRIRAPELARFLVVLVGLSLIAAYQLRRPQYDWDMLPYMVIALMDSGETFDSAHRDAYAAVRVGVPPATYDQLTDKFQGNNSDHLYRANAALFPDKFAESLPFYTVKPIYPGLIVALRMTGIDLLEAPFILAVTGYFLSCLIIYIWIRPWLTPAVAIVATLLISLFPQLTAISILPLPDSLSLFVVLLGVYLAIERRRVLVGLATLLVAIAIRPENIMYFLLFISYFAIQGNNRVALAFLTVVALCLYGMIIEFSGNYGWRTLFYFTFVDRNITPSKFVSPLRVWDYIRLYRQQLEFQVMEPLEGFAIFVLALFGAAVMKIRAGNFKDPYLYLTYLVFFLGVGRILAVPESFYRALLPCYLLATVALIHACVFSGAPYQKRMALA